MPALELEVPPLSPPEQRIFLYEKAKELKIPATLLPKPEVEEILKTANGHPSTIMQLLEDIMTDRRAQEASGGAACQEHRHRLSRWSLAACWL